MPVISRACSRASINRCNPIPASNAAEKENRNIIIDGARMELTFGIR